MKRQVLASGRGRRSSASPVPSARSKPLPAAERAFFERRLGQDFSRVRVHSDQQAAVEAAELGAKAFARGNEIAFAAGRYQPGTPEGRELLAHELTHVAQQERGGDSGPVQAESRASAAAERVARGETVSAEAQGGAAEGVYCEPDDDEKESDDAQLRSTSFKMPPLSMPSSLSMPSLLQPPALQPSTLLKPPSLLSPLDTPAPLLPPYKLMSNADILAPFSAYGVSPGKAGFDIQGDWATAFWTFRNYMPEKLAATSANTFLASAYQASFGSNQPNALDKSNLDFKAAYPNEKHLPPIPLVSSGTLTLLYETITGKKDTNAFYF